MRNFHMARSVAMLVFYGAIVSSCGTTSNTVTAPSAESADRGIQHRAIAGNDVDHTSIHSNLSSSDLLYVLDQHEVTFYTYPQGKLVGTLKNKDFYLADGACVDEKGDVYIANYGTDQLFEYRHGGKKLMRTIVPPSGATGCASDPVTGNLAIAGNGGLSVYQAARGTPTTYTDSAFEAYYYCGYDDHGNLFVDGYSQPGSGHTILAELPRGGSALQTITLDQVIQWPGQVQWDGKNLTIEDIGGVSESNGAIYKFSIEGSRALKVSTIPLNKSGVMHQSWIQGHVVLVPTHCWPKSCYGSSVLFYRYPKGGNAFNNITKDVQGPLGLVVSPGQT